MRWIDRQPDRVIQWKYILSARTKFVGARTSTHRAPEKPRVGARALLVGAQQTQRLFTEEAGELGLTRGTCFVACCLELAAVALLLLWFRWCVLKAAGFLLFVFCYCFSTSDAHALRKAYRYAAGSLASFISLLLFSRRNPTRQREIPIFIQSTTVL